MKLCHVTGHKETIITSHLGGTALKIWKGKKRLKFGVI